MLLKIWLTCHLYNWPWQMYKEFILITWHYSSCKQWLPYHEWDDENNSIMCRIMLYEMSMLVVMPVTLPMWYRMSMLVVMTGYVTYVIVVCLCWLSCRLRYLCDRRRPALVVMPVALLTWLTYHYVGCHAVYMAYVIVILSGSLCHVYEYVADRPYAVVHPIA